MLTSLKDDLFSSVQFALGLLRLTNGEFRKRISAVTRRHFTSTSLIAQDTTLTAFVLDSKTTIMVVVNYSQNTFQTSGAGSYTYRIYSGPRELIYQILKDFPLDAIKQIPMPVEYIDALYADYAMDPDLFKESPQSLSDDEIADLAETLKQQLATR